MNFVSDAQLPPALALFLTRRFGVQARHVRELGLRDADDRSIQRYAADNSAIVVTKDSDFVELVHRYGAPPQVIWVTCGNTSNLNLERLFEAHFAAALQLLADAETIVEMAAAE